MAFTAVEKDVEFTPGLLKFNESGRADSAPGQVVSGSVPEIDRGTRGAGTVRPPGLTKDCPVTLIITHEHGRMSHKGRRGHKHNKKQGHDINPKIHVKPPGLKGCKMQDSFSMY
jgi:hypothetical protein